MRVLGTEGAWGEYSSIGSDADGSECGCWFDRDVDLCFVGDDSDDEVYAAAKAADQELEAEYDSEDQLIVVKFFSDIFRRAARACFRRKEKSD